MNIPRNSYKGEGGVGGGGGGGENCNTPKYTLVVFGQFRVFCKLNLNVRELNAKHENERPGEVTKLKDKILICPKRGLKDMD